MRVIRDHTAANAMTHMVVWMVAKNRCSGGPYVATSHIDDNSIESAAVGRLIAHVLQSRHSLFTVPA